MAAMPPVRASASWPHSLLTSPRPNSGLLAYWAPDLYDYYVEHMRPLFEHQPELRRNFKNSVYPCATVNFGPVTCTFDHVDPANLPFGLCAVTALGDFDHRLGGHLVLWDLKLVIEFPPGATILIPSAILRHSNIATQPGESRYSITQYAAGGLFRWVDQRMQPTARYLDSLNKEEWEAHIRESEARWATGINLFSTLTSLQQPPSPNGA